MPLKWKKGNGKWDGNLDQYEDAEKRTHMSMTSWVRTNSHYTGKSFNLTSKQRNVNENKGTPFCTDQLAKTTRKENSAGKNKKMCAHKLSSKTFDLRNEKKIQHKRVKKQVVGGVSCGTPMTITQLSKTNM